MANVTCMLSRSSILAIYAAAASCGSVVYGDSAVVAPPDDSTLATDMADAASRWLSSLDAAGSRRARYTLADAERLDWHFIPRARHGISLGELTPPQRALAFGFLATAASRRGLVKATSIMALEQTLHDREHGRGGFVRDPSAYYLTIFGEPSPTATWGWRLEGHHLSISLTIVDGHRVVAAPAFFGASPAQVATGPMSGTRVLGREDQLGVDLLASLDETQRRAARYAPLPDDILTRPGAKLTDLPGLRGSQLTAQQRVKLAALVDEAAGNIPAELADRERSHATGAGLDAIVFTWSGGRTIDRPHYYRLSGPTFIYELDNTQEHANHVHTIWHARSPAGGDFGLDLLREHYRTDHAAGGSR